VTGLQLADLPGREEIAAVAIAPAATATAVEAPEASAPAGDDAAPGVDTAPPGVDAAPGVDAPPGVDGAAGSSTDGSVHPPKVADGVPVRLIDSAAPWGSEVGLVPGSNRFQAGLALRVGLHLMTRSTGTLSQSDRGPWLAMTMAAGATGVTIMSSGSVSTGQLALTLSLGMAGAWAASMILKVPARLDGGLAVAATALSGLLIIGHFYAELSGISAILLGLAPLTGWVASLPWVRERPVWQRTIAVVILAALLTAAVTIPTALRAMRESQSKSETSGY
jgi:hypothetical protein